jgi:hypothetical protein
LRKLRHLVTADVHPFEEQSFASQQEVHKRPKRLRCLAEFAAAEFQGKLDGEAARLSIYNHLS